MKRPNKTKVERLKALKEASKGGVGDKGLATAPRGSTKKADAPKKQGLGPVSAPLAIVSDLRVSILVGDDRDRYYRFEASGQEIVQPAKDVIEKPLQAFSALRHIGILATSPEIKNEIKTRIDHAVEDQNTIVATRVGYEREPSPRYFVYADGTIIMPDRDICVVSMIKDTGHFAHAGELSTYERGIAKVIRDQSVPTTLFFFGLMQVLKPFVANTGYKAESMMFELVGKTSTYKSALVCTAVASAWGKGHSSDGYARDWNMTDQKIEDFFQQYNDHLLILDEATMADTNDTKRAEKISNTVHRMSSGKGRARTGMETESHSVTMLSTSNQPMRSILSGTEDVRRALEVRLVSFELKHEAHSFFDTVPRGFLSVRDAMDNIFALVESNHGLLARRYILDVLTLLKRDEPRLTELIKRAMGKFIRTVGMDTADRDPVSYRRVQGFALAYAAAVVAFEAGTLEKRHWGRVKRSISQAWIKYGQDRPTVGGDPRIASYLRNPSNMFIDVRDGRKPPIVDAKFKTAAGFIFTAKDESLCLGVPKAAMPALDISAARLKQLRHEGVLRARKGLRSRLALRCVKMTEVRDVFYVFKIHELPAEIRLLRYPKS